MSSKTTVTFLGEKCEVQVNHGFTFTKLGQLGVLYSKTIGHWAILQADSGGVEIHFRSGLGKTPQEAVSALEDVIKRIRKAEL